MKFIFYIFCIVFLSLVYAKSESNYPVHWTLTLTGSMAILVKKDLTNEKCQEMSYMRYQQDTPLYCIRKVKNKTGKIYGGTVYFVAIKDVKGENKIVDLFIFSSYPGVERCRFEHQANPGNCQLIMIQN